MCRRRAFSTSSCQSYSDNIDKYIDTKERGILRRHMSTENPINTTKIGDASLRQVDEYKNSLTIDGDKDDIRFRFRQSPLEHKFISMSIMDPQITDLKVRSSCRRQLDSININNSFGDKLRVQQFEHSYRKEHDDNHSPAIFMDQLVEDPHLYQCRSAEECIEKKITHTVINLPKNSVFKDRKKRSIQAIKPLKLVNGSVFRSEHNSKQSPTTSSAFKFATGEFERDSRLSLTTSYSRGNSIIESPFYLIGDDKVIIKDGMNPELLRNKLAYLSRPAVYEMRHIGELDKIKSNGSNSVGSHQSISEIIPGLYIGNERDAMNVSLLENSNIKNIINVSEESIYNEKSDLHYYKFNIKDNGIQNLSIELMKKIFLIIDSSLIKGENILVHCTMGLSRSVAIVILYLIVVKDYNLTTAFNIMESKRRTMINLSFMGQINTIYLQKKLYQSYILKSK